MMVLNTVQRGLSWGAGRVILAMVAASLVMGIGAIAIAKKPLGGVSAHVVEFARNDQQQEDVFPNELVVLDGDIIKFENNANDKDTNVTVKISVPKDLLVDHEGKPITVIEIGKDGSRLVAIAPGAGETFKTNPTVYYDVTFADPAKDETEYVKARPRIIVNPPSS